MGSFIPSPKWSTTWSTFTKNFNAKFVTNWCRTNGTSIVTGDLSMKTRGLSDVRCANTAQPISRQVIEVLSLLNLVNSESRLLFSLTVFLGKLIFSIWLICWNCFRFRDQSQFFYRFASKMTVHHRKKVVILKKGKDFSTFHDNSIFYR